MADVVKRTFPASGARRVRSVNALRGGAWRPCANKRPEEHGRHRLRVDKLGQVNGGSSGRRRKSNVPTAVMFIRRSEVKNERL
jgi:hypothetical protein